MDMRWKHPPPPRTLTSRPPPARRCSPQEFTAATGPDSRAEAADESANGDAEDVPAPPPPTPPIPHPPHRKEVDEDAFV
eukprot:3691958-Pyramimonas_sp.AAC.1